MTDKQQPRQWGKYEILEEIGRGGFAVVYKARDTSLGRIVALKVLAPHLAWEREFAARFQNEAKAVARLRHANIVTIHEIGEESERLYIAMEYLEGRTLAQVMADEGALSLERTIAILGQVSDALDYAHEQGILHLDVKPANIMVEEGVRTKLHATLMDFGLVKAMSGSTASASQSTLLGSPEYMAPEQADPDRKDEIGPATDRYALGVVVYQMLTGRVPFPGNKLATLNAHLNLPPPDPQVIRPDLPTSVAQVLLKALAKKPADRYQNAEGMVQALQKTVVVEELNKQRKTQLADLYNRAVKEINAGRWQEAQQFLVQVQRIAPGYRETRRLLTRVRAEIAGGEAKRQPKEEEPSIPVRSAFPCRWAVGVGAIVVAIALCAVGLFAASQIRGWLIPTPTTAALVHTAISAVPTLIDTPRTVPTNTPKPPAPTVTDTMTPPSTNTPTSMPTATATATATPTATSVPTATPTATPLPTPDPRNVLMNGDFHEDWVVGWRRAVLEGSSGEIVHEVINSSQGRSGRALHLLYRDDGQGDVAIIQDIPVNHINFLFRGKFSLDAVESQALMPKTGYARLWIGFCDASGEVIGSIQYIYCGGKTCGQSSSNTAAVFVVEKGWRTEELNFQQTIPSLLPGMSRENVAQIRIVLAAGSPGQGMMDLDSCYSGCTGEVFATDLELIDLTR